MKMKFIESVTYEEELQRNPELKESDIQALREWCIKQPHLPRIAHNQLARFLHSNYYRIEPTKLTIDAFYTIQSNVPEFFKNRDPIGDKRLREAFQSLICTPLSGKTVDGYKLMYIRLFNSDVSTFCLNNLIKYWCMVCDLWVETEGTMKGHIVVIDMTGVTLNYIPRVNPIILRNFFQYLQEALPVRLKGFHCINSVPATKIIFNMIKPFIKNSVLETIHIHSSNETLAKYFSIDILPNESGGKAGSLKELHEENIEWIKAHRAWFLHNEITVGVKEFLRPVKNKNTINFFDNERNFKKLDID